MPPSPWPMQHGRAPASLLHRGDHESPVEPAETAPGRSDATLLDYRPVVTEHALGDGFHATYYYVDARGLENASMDELRALLADAGVGWPDRLDGQQVHASHELKQDAQCRDILEVAVIRPPLD